MTIDPSLERATPEAIHDQHELLRVERRRLQHLLVQRGRYGPNNTPYSVVSDIDDARAKIAAIKATFQGWQVPLADHPNDIDEDYLPEDRSVVRSIDPEIHTLRTAAYLELWAELKALARYDLPQPLTTGVLNDLSIALRNWYFERGGLFLSEASRAPYFELKEGIRQIVAAHSSPDDTALTTAEIARVMAIASQLRASLAHDLGTR